MGVVRVTTLKRGSRGRMVALLQDMLKKCGANAGETDGVFGKKTQTALKAFQRAQRISADGKAGLQTFERLYKLTGDVPRSEHFNFKTEFDRPHRADKAKFYVPCPLKYYANAQELFFEMEDIRAELNRLYGGNGREVRLITLSGYRGTAYNKACDGAKASKHLTGEGLDFYAVRVDTSTGARETRVPNCYQIGQVMEKIGKGGTGYGSNNNVHRDIRARRARWWYGYKTWALWKINQGRGA
jgi:peptidoglycan hydrolase-like protein with peptidoglycan-binding domain